MTESRSRPMGASAGPGHTSDVPVLVVGAGPTGLMLANLLGGLEIETVVVERNPGTVAEPRAVSFDDESLRTLQGCGLQAEAYDVVLRGTGTKYYGVDGRPLGYARGPAAPPLGHPIKNPFSQPEFESMLLRGLARYGHVNTRHSVTLERLELDGELGAVATVRDEDGQPERIRAQLVIGCDGGRSAVRGATGVRMLGTSFGQPWLVIDVLGDHHDQRYAMHHCDPRRPYVIVPGRDGRCRYEFMVLPGEDPAELVRIPAVRTLLAPFRELAAEQVERCTVYTFHALIAERWRTRGALLAGDAAHMMPPFAGQGLNSGIRDAANLAWKVAAVVSGRADPGLLDTYEAERRPHAQSTVAFSTRLGRIMMSRRVLAARVRDAVIRSASAAIPSVHRYIAEGRFKPAARYGTGGALILDADAGELVGRMLRQPMVLDTRGSVVPLDDVLGSGFALLGVDLPAGTLHRPSHAVWRVLDPTLVELLLDDRSARSAGHGVSVIADVDGSLTTALDAYRGRILLIRPDRFVAAALHPDLERAAELVGRALHTRVGRRGPAEQVSVPTTSASS